MRKLHLIIIAISLFVAGCSTESTRNTFLTHVDSLQRINSDSAFNLLYENKTNFLLPEDKAYYSLLYCETYLRKPLFFQTNQDIDTLIAYYKQHDESRLLARALLCKSLNQYKHGHYKDALNNAIAAEQNTETNDTYQQCLIKQQLGLINLSNGCYQRALQQFKEARRAARAFKTNLPLIAQCYLHESHAHKRLGHADSTMQCLKQALPFIDKTEHHTYAEAMTSIGEWYLDHKDYAHACAYLAQAYPFDYSYHAAMAMGNLWQSKGNMPKAEDYWYQAANSNDHETRMAALDSLLKSKPDNTFLLQEYRRATKDAPHINTDEIAQLQADYEHATLQKRAYQRINALLTGIICLAFLIFIGHRYYKNKLKTLRHSLNNINARYLNDLEQYQQARSKISLLEKRIASYQDDKKAPEKWNIENEMLTNSCVISLHRLASRGQTAPESNWQELALLIANHDTPLIKLLNQSDLNAKERHICMLIRLRFIPSELSALLGISPQSVTNMRQRLLQKLFHEKGGAKDFDERIRAVSS